MSGYKNLGLDEVVRAARGVGVPAKSAGRLSGGARARILEEAMRGDDSRRFWPALFAPAGRLMVAGSLPLVLAGALMFLMNRSMVQAPTPVTVPETTTQVQVAKLDGSLRFTIANGGREHVLYRSTSPDRFEAANAVQVVDGAYVEALDDTASLVFYRID